MRQVSEAVTRAFRRAIRGSQALPGAKTLIDDKTQSALADQPRSLPGLRALHAQCDALASGTEALLGAIRVRDAAAKAFASAVKPADIQSAAAALIEAEAACTAAGKMASQALDRYLDHSKNRAPEAV